MAACAATLYLNPGGGEWYFAWSIITIWFFWGFNYQQISRKSANAFGSGLLILYLIVSFSDAGGFPVRLALTRKKANDFMCKLRALEKISTLASEDSFFFRKFYNGELIDLGDYAWFLSESGFFGKAFTATAKSHFEHIKNYPPDFIVTGIVASPVLEKLLVAKYDLLEIGPNNLIADRKYNPKFYSKLFVRKDFVFPKSQYSK